MDQYTKKTDPGKSSFLLAKVNLDQTTSGRNRSKNDDLMKELSTTIKIAAPVPKA